MPAKRECECSSTSVNEFIDLTCRGKSAVDIEKTELVNGSVWEGYHGGSFDRRKQQQHLGHYMTASQTETNSGSQVP